MGVSFGELVGRFLVESGLVIKSDGPVLGTGVGRFQDVVCVDTTGGEHRFVRSFEGFSGGAVSFLNGDLLARGILWGVNAAGKIHHRAASVYMVSPGLERVVELERELAVLKADFAAFKARYESDRESGVVESYLSKVDSGYPPADVGISKEVEADLNRVYEDLGYGNGVDEMWGDDEGEAALELVLDDVLYPDLNDERAEDWPMDGRAG